MVLMLVDVETTGLDTDNDKLLEVGMCMVSDNLDLMGSKSYVINLPRIEYISVLGRYEPPFGVHKDVVEMHNKNGLWEECKNSKLDERAAENKLLFWLSLFPEINWEQVPLMGNTVGSFDRQFLRRNMPNLESMFHYRNLDVSSIRIASDLWGKPVENTWSQDEKPHRAIPDCLESLAQMKAYRSVYFSQA